MAGGVESMSRVSMGSDGGGFLMDPAQAINGHMVPQGVSADLIASKYGYSRADVDAFAYESQMRATKAEKEKRFVSRIPVKDINGITVLDTDENIRPTTTLEGLNKLSPSFEMIGTMGGFNGCLLYTSPSPRDQRGARMPSSA